MKQAMLNLDSPLSFGRDPRPSREAKQRHVDSGMMASNANYVLELVRRWPDSTSRELFETYACKLDLVEVRRRLTGLLNEGRVVQGEVRVCRRVGTKAVTWKTKG